MVRVDWDCAWRCVETGVSEREHAAIFRGATEIAGIGGARRDVWYVPRARERERESDCSVRSKDGQSRGRERTGEDAYHRARDATGKHERVSKVSDGIIFPAGVRGRFPGEHANLEKIRVDLRRHESRFVVRERHRDWGRGV